jgi:hypothetical protein
MEWLGAIGGGGFILACLIVGVRLLLLARRTRELPELAMGLGLLLMGGLSYPINVVARVSVELPEGNRVALMVFSQLLMWIGCVAIGVFNWKVFRPQARWPAWLVAGFTLALIGFFLAQCLGQGLFAFIDGQGGVYRFAITAQGIPYLWAFAESFLYHRKLRKRLELGLADPVVTRRVGFWALTTGASTAINQCMVLLEVLGIDSATSLVAALFVGPVGLVAAVGLWFAFDAPGSRFSAATPASPS